MLRAAFNFDGLLLRPAGPNTPACGATLVWCAALLFAGRPDPPQKGHTAGNVPRHLPDKYNIMTPLPSCQILDFPLVLTQPTYLASHQLDRERAAVSPAGTTRSPEHLRRCRRWAMGSRRRARRWSRQCRRGCSARRYTAPGPCAWACARRCRRRSCTCRCGRTPGRVRSPAAQPVRQLCMPSICSAAAQCQEHDALVV